MLKPVEKSIQEGQEIRKRAVPPRAIQSPQPRRPSPPPAAFSNGRGASKSSSGPHGAVNTVCQRKVQEDIKPTVRGFPALLPSVTGGREWSQLPTGPSSLLGLPREGHLAVNQGKTLLEESLPPTCLLLLQLPALVWEPCAWRVRSLS